MINLKALLTKLLNKEQKIGVSTDSHWATIYPVNSVYMTSTNTNPGTFLGGTWTLIHKYFKYDWVEHTTGVTGGLSNPVVWNNTSSGMTMNGTNYTRAVISDDITYPATCVISHYKDIIRLHLRWQNYIAISDSTQVICKIPLSALGCSSLYWSRNTNGWSDGLNAVGMFRADIYGTDLYIYTVDWANKTAAYNTGTAGNIYLYMDLMTTNDNRLDSACDKFYWKRDS